MNAPTMLMRRWVGGDEGADPADETWVVRGQRGEPFTDGPAGAMTVHTQRTGCGHIGRVVHRGGTPVHHAPRPTGRQSA